MSARRLALVWVELLALVALPLRAVDTASLVSTATWPNYHAAGVVVTIAGDDDSDAGVSLESRRTGEPAFVLAHPLVRIDTTRFAGSLFWLQPATAYDLRVVLADPDGTTGSPTATTSFTTRSDAPVEPTTRTLYVSPTGSDSAAGTSPATALLTIQEAANRSSPGDLVLIAPGIYRERVVVPSSGTALQPIVFRGNGPGAILDGADLAIALGVPWTSEGSGVHSRVTGFVTSHVVSDQGRLYRYTSLAALQALGAGAPGGFYFDGTTLRVKFSDGSVPAARTLHVARSEEGFFLDGRSFVRIENFEIRHYGSATFGKGVYLRYASDCAVRNSRIHEVEKAGVWIRGGARNLVEGNELWDTSIFGWPWSQTKGSSAENNGVRFTHDIGQGNVVRRNAIYGSFNGIGPCGDSPPPTGITSETDVYENDFSRHTDDAFEPEGHCSNVRIWGNRLTDVHMAVAPSPAAVGPAWVLRNAVTGIGNTRTSQIDGFAASAIKINNGFPTPSGPLFVYHNTFHTTAPATNAVTLQTPGLTTYILGRNNIFAGTRYVLEKVNPVTLDWDTDLLYTSDSTRFVKWEGPTYLSLAALQAATGQELDGLAAPPDLLNPAASDLRPAPTSPVIDRGVLVPGINDDYDAADPDIGAFEWRAQPVEGGIAGDRIWLDRDRDGIGDVGEPGIAAVTVRLHDDLGGLVATTTTDRLGGYLFAAVAPGDYEVRVDETTLPGAAGDLVLSPAAANPSAQFTFTAGSRSLGVDFGYGSRSGAALLGDLLWSDADGDGVQDPGEPGLGGVTLDLVDLATATVLDTTSSDPDGSYLFSGVGPGEYRVLVTDTGSTLTGYLPTAGPQSAGESASVPFTVAPGDAVTEADFGFRNATLHTVSNRIWLDTDSDGIKDTGESGQEGVTVDLCDGSSNLLTTATSGANGDVSFAGLKNGSYTLVITDHGAALLGQNGTTAAAQAGQLVVSVAGGPVSGVDFGYAGAATIGGLLWLDADADRVRDAGEMGIGGVTLERRTAPGTQTVASLTTAAGGAFRFAGLAAGGHRIVVTDSGGRLTGLVQTGDPDATLDGQAIALVSDATGQLRVDFGYRDLTPAEVSGTVFEDLDADGVEEPGEPGLAGVTVALLDAGGDRLAVTATTGSGGFSFPAVLAGDYAIAVTDQGAVLEGFHLTSGLDARPVTVAAASIAGVDFGYARSAATGAISGRLWLDADDDGAANGSEAGVSVVSVKLYADSDDDGARSVGDTLITTLATLPDGRYQFTGLPPGIYFADPDEATLPAGLVATVGTGLDSGAIPLSRGELFDRADFGYRPAAGTVLGDLIFFDADGDGLPAPGEVGTAGVEVRVTGPGGYDQTTDTGPDGRYLVTGITISGAYTVAVNTTTLPAGLDPTPTSFSSATQAFNLEAGVDLLFADFGFQETVPGTSFGAIGDTVFLDHDGNGTQDLGEPGLASVTMSLLDAASAPLATTTTDQNGGYEFQGMPAGSYRVLASDTAGALAGLNLSAGTNPTAPIVLLAGQVHDAADFGFAPSAGAGAIGNFIWHDRNGDGNVDAGESGIEGVEIVLYRDANGNGLLEAGQDPSIRSTSSNRSGEYYFHGVPFGQYLVKLESPNNVVSGLVTSVGLPGVNDNSQVNPAPVTLDNSRAPSLFRVDFGYWVSGAAYSTSGAVFFDNDGDGLRDPPLETGIAGAELWLYRDLDADQVLDPDDPVFGRTTSGAAGAYSFTNLPDSSNWLAAVDTTGTFLAGGTQTTQLLTAGIEPVAFAGASQAGRDFGFTRPPTLALVSSFAAAEAGGVVHLEWQTASEIGTLGFFLERWSAADRAWVRVYEGLLPAPTGAPRGAVYRVVDSGAAAGEELTYLLIESELGGGLRHHGPFTVIAEEPGEPLDRLDDEGTRATARPASPLERERLVRAGRSIAHAEATPGRLTDSPDSFERRSATHGDALRLGVSLEGFQFVSAMTIASTLALPLQDVEARILSGDLSLSHLGAPVAWWAEDPSGIYFFGREPSSIYSATAAYVLALQPGTVAASANGGQPQPLPGGGFPSTEGFEQNLFAATAATRDPESDYWYWAVLAAGDPNLGSRSLAFELRNLHDDVASHDAGLELRVFGASSALEAPDHWLVVELNGARIASEAWDGAGAKSLSIGFPASLLRAGPNTLALTALLPPGVAASVLYVDSFAVTYRRAYRAAGNRLHLRAQHGETVTVSGFDLPDLRVVDVTSPALPVLVTGTTLDDGDGYRVSFVSPGPGREVFVAAASEAGVPTAARIAPSDLLDPPTGADYLILAPGSLVAAAQRLADHRAAQGRLTRVIELEEIYDTFSHGQPSPWAIRDFLTFAWRNWPVKPDHVVLIGKGSYDYRDYLRAGTGLLPVLMVATPHGLFASDSSYGDVAGDDGAPEIAIGRIPVLSAQELDEYVDKLLAYEAAGTAPGDRRVVLLADDSDVAGAFAADSDAVLARLPPAIESDRIYLDELSILEVRAALAQSLSAGARLLGYHGHGGLDRLAAEGLLTTGDVAALPSAGRLPIVGSWTCAVGRFEVPGATSLGEALVLAVDRGAIAVLAPSGLSFSDAARLLSEEVAESLFDGRTATLGDALRAALGRYREHGAFGHMLRIYNLLGDPALPLPPLPQIDDGGALFSDGFESGDLDAWSG